MHAPGISIVTCSYNQNRFLDATIRSVIGQTGSAFEYIVVDGASIDGSVDTIRKYDSHISHWMSEPDRGQSEALNKGLHRARGEIIGWLCSDDVLLPGALTRVLQIFDQHPDVDMVYGNAVLIDARGGVIRSKREIEFHPWLMLNDHNYIPQPAAFWRRSLLDKLGYLREDLHLTMDLELWLRFAKNNAKVLHVNDFFAGMRCHDSQKVFTQLAALKQEHLGIKESYAPHWPSVLPRPMARTLARGARVALKCWAGAYSKAVPPQVVDALRVLHGGAEEWK